MSDISIPLIQGIPCYDSPYSWCACKVATIPYMHIHVHVHIYMYVECHRESWSRREGATHILKFLHLNSVQEDPVKVQC